MNQVLIIGRITKDIECKYTAAGTAVAKFNVAVDRGKDKNGEDRGADFIGCIAFGRTAENLEKFSGKGLRVAVEGHIQTGSYEKDGHKVYTTDVICDKVEFVDWKQSGQKATTYDAPAGFSEIDETVPF
jgi:single-strand DNA-binding protein